MFSLSESTSRGYSQKINDKIIKMRPNQTADHQRATGVVEEIRKILIQHPPLNKGEYQMSGSLVKDTYIRNREEFDLIISLPDNISDYIPNEISRVKLMKLVAKALAIKQYNPSDLTLEYQKSGYKVDIVPSFKIDTKKFIALSLTDQKPYLGHMSLKHIEFVHKRGKKYQDLCRLTKYWANGPADPDQEHYCSSFFVELVTADVYDKFDNKKFIDLFEAILRRFKNLNLKGSNKNRKFIAFDDFYAKMENRKKWINQLTVLDPINPKDNIVLKPPQNAKLNTLIGIANATLDLWSKKGFEDVFNEYFT